MRCWSASFRHSNDAAFNIEKSNAELFVFVKGHFVGSYVCSCPVLCGCLAVQKPTWFLRVPPVGSQQACPPVCALATELFLQVQKSLLHCSAAQPYNQALFLF